MNDYDICSIDCNILIYIMYLYSVTSKILYTFMAV